MADVDRPRYRLHWVIGSNGEIDLAACGTRLNPQGRLSHDGFWCTGCMAAVRAAYPESRDARTDLAPVRTWTDEEWLWAMAAFPPRDDILRAEYAIARRREGA